METKKNNHNKYQCPCCSYYTFNEPLGNTFEDCPVCFWEDDGVQLSNPDYKGGANKMSLNQARENFRKHGVISPEFKAHVRLPKQEELETSLLVQ